MTFDLPLVALAAPLIALLIGGAAWAGRQRRLRRAAAWSPALGVQARASGRWTPVLLGFAGLAAAVALSGPRWGRAEIRTQSDALNVVMAFDISRSMLAEDVAPNRLARAVREAKRLVQDLRGDRIGLLGFAGRSYILAPLTVDESAIRMYLDALSPDLASRGGTELGGPLQQGGQLLQAAEGPADRVLIVFSDGEGHDTLGATLEHAEALGEAGIHLVMVGVGTPQPTRIPLRDSLGNATGYVTAPDGMVVESRLEEGSLRAIAEAANGTYVGPELSDQAGAVRDLLARLQRSPTAERRTADQIPRAWIPALIAALLLLVATVTRRTASLVGLGGCLLTGACVGPPNEAARAAARGDAAEAATLYLDEARRGEAPDTAFYNAGTAALDAERPDVARGALDEAARSLDPSLRYRALYNAGTAALLAAEQDSAQREALLAQAVDRLQQALMLEPSSQRAKWNLELALRQRPPSGGGGGGGGGGGETPPAPQGGGQADTEPQPQPGLSERQAEQILSSMERQERETRAAQIRRRQGGAAAGVRDW